MARRRHAQHYVLNVLAPMRDEYLLVADRDHVVDRFETEWEQLRTAQAWAASSGDSRLARLYATYGDPLVRLRHRPSIVRQWITPSLSDAFAMRDPGIRAENLNRVAVTHYNSGEFAEAKDMWLQALEVHRQVNRIGNEHYVDMQEAGYRSNLGSAEERLGDRDGARAAYELARAVFHRLGEGEQEGRMWLNLGTLDAELDAHQEAIEAYQRAADLARGSNDTDGLELALGAMGNSLADLKRLPEARVMLEQALTLSRLRRDKAREAVRLGNLARVMFVDGDLDGALRLRSEALALAREMDDPRTEALQLLGLGDVHKSREEDELAEPCYADAERIFTAIGMRDAASRARQAGVSAATRQSLRSTIVVYNGLIGEQQSDEAIAALDQWFSLGHATTPQQHSLLLGLRGVAEHLSGRLERAAQCFGEALSLDADRGRDELAAQHLGNVGDLYRQLGDASHAEFVYSAGMQFAGITDALREKLGYALHLAQQMHTEPIIGGLDEQGATGVGLEIVNRSLAGNPVHITVTYVSGVTIAGQLASFELGPDWPEITLQLAGGLPLHLAFEWITCVQVLP